MVESRILTILILSIGLTALAIVLVIFKMRKVQAGTSKTDYRVFFILGIVWLPIGLAIDNSVFLVLGIVYMIIGLANRDKWAKSKKDAYQDKIIVE